MRRKMVGKKRNGIETENEKMWIGNGWC